MRQYSDAPFGNFLADVTEWAITPVANLSGNTVERGTVGWGGGVVNLNELLRKIRQYYKENGYREISSITCGSEVVVRVTSQAENLKLTLLEKSAQLLFYQIESTRSFWDTFHLN